VNGEPLNPLKSLKSSAPEINPLKSFFFIIQNFLEYVKKFKNQKKKSKKYFKNIKKIKNNFMQY